jgi:hypothetical protein
MNADDWDTEKIDEYGILNKPKGRFVHIKFDGPLKIDEFDIFTGKGGSTTSEEDVCKWRFYGRKNDKEKWKALTRFSLTYPIDKERDILIKGKLISQGRECIRVGKKQDGAVFHNSGEDWKRMRGVWFDAFCEILIRLKLPMDRGSAWSLWRRCVSTKYDPVVLQQTPGFISVRDLKYTLFELMATEPFLSDATFFEFNELSRLQFGRDHAKKLYGKICSKTEDYLGAPNLVSWDDFDKKMRRHVLHSRPYVIGSHGAVALGGLWFEPLYRIIIKSMPEVPDRDEVRAHFQSFLDPTTGLLPLDRVVAVIAKLGRPGLKFEQFSSLITKIGFNISEELLKSVFLMVDLDHSYVMDSEEAVLGISLLVHEHIPRLVLEEAGLSTVQIVRYVTGVCIFAFFLFAFVLIAFSSFTSGGSLGEGKDWQSSIVQSLLMGVVSYGIERESVSIFDEHQILSLVSHNVEKIMGCLKQGQTNLN